MGGSTGSTLRMPWIPTKLIQVETVKRFSPDEDNRLICKLISSVTPRDALVSILEDPGDPADGLLLPDLKKKLLARLKELYVPQTDKGKRVNMVVAKDKYFVESGEGPVVTVNRRQNYRPPHVATLLFGTHRHSHDLADDISIVYDLVLPIVRFSCRVSHGSRYADEKKLAEKLSEVPHKYWSLIFYHLRHRHTRVGQSLHTATENLSVHLRGPEIGSLGTFA